MIYDDIVGDFIKRIEKVNKNINVIIEIKLTAYDYNVYGDKNIKIEQNNIIDVKNNEDKENNKL